MKDERIIKEINQIKGYVLSYIFIATLILTILKLLMRFVQFEYFYVEIFVVLLSAITFCIVAVLKSSDLDERIEDKIKQTYKFSFIFLTVGGLWVHFYQVLTNFTQMQVSLYITNTLILIGFIVTVILLKRKDLYANYKFIEYKKTTYYKHILFNIFLLLITFVMIYFTTRLVIAEQLSQLISMIYTLIISLSFLLISVEYLIFSIYEKNHYDEKILFEKQKPNHISKNVFVFHVILFFFSAISAIINLRYMSIVMSDFIDNREEIKFWSAINRANLIMSIDPIILSLIASLILYQFLKKLIGAHIVLRLYFWYLWFGFIISIFTYIFNLVIPLISIAGSSEVIINIMTTYNYISIGMAVLSTTAKLGFLIYLFIKNIKYKWILLSYSVLSMLTSYPVFNLINPFDIHTMRYIYLGISLFTGVFYLVLLWLYSHEPYLNYKSIKSLDDVYESKLVET